MKVGITWLKSQVNEEQKRDRIKPQQRKDNTRGSTDDTSLIRRTNSKFSARKKTKPKTSTNYLGRKTHTHSVFKSKTVERAKGATDYAR